MGFNSQLAGMPPNPLVDPGFFKGWWLVSWDYSINGHAPKNVAVGELEIISLKTITP